MPQPSPSFVVWTLLQGGRFVEIVILPWDWGEVLHLGLELWERCVSSKCRARGARC